MSAEGHSIRLGNYDLCRTLGRGTFGKVKLGVHIRTGHQVAVKIVSREKLKTMDVATKMRREIQNLQDFRHPHIVKLYQVISTPTDIFLVMEYVSGGELFQFILRNQRLPEPEARRFFQQMMSGVRYCHSRRIVHRDLKPENLLLDAQLVNLKIADFGLSNIMADGELLRTSCGSPNYAAPEIITGQLYVGPEVDVWSSGVILYALLCGCLPFDDEDVGALYRKIKAGKFVIPSHVSDGAADLLRWMLQVDSTRRATVDAIRRHPWFQAGLAAYLFPPDLVVELDTSVVDAAAVSDAAQRCGVEERAVLAALLGGDPHGQQFQLVAAYHLLLDRRLRASASASALEEAALRRERLREFYVAEPAQPQAQAQAQHPERMERGVPMSRNLEVATSSRGARAKWHLGLRSQSRPQDIMQELYKALLENSFEWKVINDFRVRARRFNAATGDYSKMSLQLFLVTKDNSFLLDFRQVLSEDQQQRQQPPQLGVGSCDDTVDWLAAPLSPNFSHTIEFFEMASAVITSLTG